MVTPRLALRFRDTTPGINSINEHRKIISSKGTVWWGWWKKNYEPAYSILFSELIQKGSGYIYLIDKSTDKCYLAHYIQVLKSNSNKLAVSKVPKYYKAEISKVAGWFLLDQITDIDYKEDIGLRIGNATLLILDGSEKENHPEKIGNEIKTSKQGILHLTDLHFGKEHAFLSPSEKQAIKDGRYSLTKCIVDDLKRIGLHEDIGCILITGDFTTAGDWSNVTKSDIITELNSLCRALGLNTSHIITIPGNHDVVRYPPGTKPEDIAKLNVANQTTYKHETKYKAFIEKFIGRSKKEPLNYNQIIALKEVDVIVSALNSCSIAATEMTEYGYVGDLGLDVLKSVKKIKTERATYRILAIHHHLIPVNSIEKPQLNGISLTLDAVELLNAAQSVGIHLIIHGHQHQPQIMRYEQLPIPTEPMTNENPMIIISGGSSGAKWKPVSVRNTYSVLKFTQNEAILIMRELRVEAVEGLTLYNNKLPIQPVEAIK